MDAMSRSCLSLARMEHSSGHEAVAETVMVPVMLRGPRSELERMAVKSGQLMSYSIADAKLLIVTSNLSRKADVDSLMDRIAPAVMTQ